MREQNMVRAQTMIVQNLRFCIMKNAAVLGFSFIRSWYKPLLKQLSLRYFHLPQTDEPHSQHAVI
jgi:hypothetical protein